MSIPEAITTTTDHEPISQNEQVVRGTVTPLPKLQVFIVYLTQLSEPVTGTVIYPFINQFVRETGVTKGDERKTGYFAGMIVSGSFHWDRILSVLMLSTGVCILHGRSTHSLPLGPGI